MDTTTFSKNIPIFILAGGLGTRLSEETSQKPKPMVEIGEDPILLHIMRSYYRHGFNDFVICAGYQAWQIKKYFADYASRLSDIEIDHRESSSTPTRSLLGERKPENWRVTVIDTGLESMTGARVAIAYDKIHSKRPFAHFGLTYGDGLCDVDLAQELQFHLSHGKIGTVLAVHPLARFGELETSPDGSVKAFREKPQSTQGLINGGFFFFQSQFRKYLDTDRSLVLEQEPLVRLARDGGLCAFKHTGFWHPMDTLRDKKHLEKLWESGSAPWAKT